MSYESGIYDVAGGKAFYVYLWESGSKDCVWYYGDDQHVLRMDTSLGNYWMPIDCGEGGNDGGSPTVDWVSPNLLRVKAKFPTFSGQQVIWATRDGGEFTLRTFTDTVTGQGSRGQTILRRTSSSGAELCAVGYT